MKELNMDEQRKIEGGKTYCCPFCKRNGITRKFRGWQFVSYTLHLNSCIYRYN